MRRQMNRIRKKIIRSEVTQAQTDTWNVLTYKWVIDGKHTIIQRQERLSNKEGPRWGHMNLLGRANRRDLMGGIELDGNGNIKDQVGR